jgi:hypothetical protein
MSLNSRMNRATLLALGSLMIAAPVALAQTAPPADVAAAEGAPDRSDSDPGDRFPVFAITGVEVLHSNLQPQIQVITVRGLASADGWSDGELVPLTRGTPPDGVLDLVFVAIAPLESAAPTGYTPMHAVLPLSVDFQVKAVRVRSATNSVLLKDLQGAAEARAPIEPCKDCIGRHFVAKGAAVPSGMDETQVLRAENLPPDSRIIRATDGIADVHRDPDRLTILVGEDDRVVDAVWE